ncbi:hypothetical protein PoB_004482600 [Plakobranchus ocellatus]|uniref:Uncharacterized protein n=1 Tax=Plakobranchus ocellatus TaxID=259542 RepID=A0AAV4BD42_9GAST|nr:hypothetical protein PoB_004482600 [Plakobranchus ocellatus]
MYCWTRELLPPVWARPYTPSRRCGSSTGIKQGPIERKVTSRLGSINQCCPTVLREGSGHGWVLSSDGHYCLTF